MRSRRSEATVARRYCVHGFYFSRGSGWEEDVTSLARSHAPDGAVEASGSKAKALSDVL